MRERRSYPITIIPWEKHRLGIIRLNRYDGRYHDVSTWDWDLYARLVWTVQRASFQYKMGLHCRQQKSYTAIQWGCIYVLSCVRLWMFSFTKAASMQPDPVISRLRPDRHFGSISEHMNKLIDNYMSANPDKVLTNFHCFCSDWEPQTGGLICHYLVHTDSFGVMITFLISGLVCCPCWSTDVSW